MTVDVTLGYGYKVGAVGPGAFLVSATSNIQYRIETSKPSDELRGHPLEVTDAPITIILLTGESIYFNGDDGQAMVTDVTGSSGAAPSPNTNLSAPSEFSLSHALVEVAAMKGSAASFKGKALRKFGRNEALNDTTFETIWLGGDHEVYPNGNDIDRVVSDSALDTQEIVIEGHTIDGNGDLTFTIQTVTLTGLVEVTLPTPLARATRMYNNGSADFNGTVYVYENEGGNGVPQNSDNIHLRTDGTNNQSLKCATAISKDDYWIITQVFAAVNERTTASVDFRLQIREKGKTFRTQYSLAASRGAAVNFTLDPPIIVKPNSDVRMIARASANNISAEANMAGYLVQ